MNNNTRQHIQELVTSLIKQGHDVCDKAQPDGLFPGNVVPSELFAAWASRCKLLDNLLGRNAASWHESLICNSNRAESAHLMLGAVQAIDEALQRGLLLRVEDLVWAEAFDNLLEQADHLLGGGYLPAAGVLGRVVLEEHLRNWCARTTCLPAGKRPMMSKFIAELHKAKHLNTLRMKHVESMAAVGNDAAHNNPELRKEDVERLLRDVREFLEHHPAAAFQ